MKIVLIVPVFPQESETFIVNKFTGLIRKGINVYILCNKTNDEIWNNFTELKNNLHYKKRVIKNWPTNPKYYFFIFILPAIFHCLKYNPKGFLNFFKRTKHLKLLDKFRLFYLNAKLISLKPNLIHYEFGTLMIGNEEISKIIGSHSLVSFRGYDLNFSGLGKKDYYKKVWQNANVVHVLGEDLWKRAKMRGCPTNKPHIKIPPAIDGDYFKPSYKKIDQEPNCLSKKINILSVGRLEWKKGYEFAIQSIRILKNYGVGIEYQIIGSGSYYKSLAFITHQLSLESDVKFLGSKKPDEVKQYMEWADIFLHAAVSEGFCNAVLEAQAMQLPVVTSDADGLGENIQDGVTGFLVPRRDPQMMAEKLFILAKKPELRQQMGLAGRKRVETNFKIEDQINSFAKLYKDLVNH